MLPSYVTVIVCETLNDHSFTAPCITINQLFCPSCDSPSCDSPVPKHMHTNVSMVSSCVLKCFCDMFFIATSQISPTSICDNYVCSHFNICLYIHDPFLPHLLLKLSVFLSSKGFIFLRK